MNTTELIVLTKEEALAIFCFKGINSVSIIKVKQEQLTAANHETLIRDIRGMLLITKIYLNYKSNEVRTIVQNMCERFISDIYKNEKSSQAIKNLWFMVPIVLRFRNVKNYKFLKTVELDKTLIESTRQHLLNLSAINTYQKLLF